VCLAPIPPSWLDLNKMKLNAITPRARKITAILRHDEFRGAPEPHGCSEVIGSEYGHGAD
ncbi:MAG: hypothetical protein ACREA0_27625, partial [bacterium]